MAAAFLRGTIKLRKGRWSFNQPVKWMTALGQPAYDATMRLAGNKFEISFPDSSERLSVSNSVGMRAIARVLMVGNIPCPCSLVVDGLLLDEFLSRPPHHKYFKAIYRRPKVECGNPRNGEIENAICTGMRLRPGWCYYADHVICGDSELHTVCGIPTGMVTLARADALEGIRDLIKKQAARLFFCGEPNPKFRGILSDIEAGILFARKNEDLLQQVQPQCEKNLAKVQKGIYRAIRELESMGDWTTRYDRLAAHFSQHIKGGIVMQYCGPNRWKVEGISGVTDTLDMAADHVDFKRRRVRRARRQADKCQGAIPVGRIAASRSIDSRHFNGITS